MVHRNIIVLLYYIGRDIANNSLVRASYTHTHTHAKTNIVIIDTAMHMDGASMHPVVSVRAHTILLQSYIRYIYGRGEH